MPDVMVPLEDELGDVLEKAIRTRALTLESISERVNIVEGRLRDALDYRSDLTCTELTRLAEVLQLNEVGLCALAKGSYPLPTIPDLPFSLHSLHMSHGVGVANAYILSEYGSSEGILFDTGPSFAVLHHNWPLSLQSVEAVFLTHLEPEHAGGICEAVSHFDIQAAYVPTGCQAPCGEPLEDAQAIYCGAFEVIAYSTPGHASFHQCYRVRLRHSVNDTAEVLIAGDLIFAGSAGGAYFSNEQQQSNLKRILDLSAPNAVIASGHGPLTTVAHERNFNPFL